MVPSGLSPYPRMTIAGLEKSFTAAAGSAWETAGEIPPTQRRQRGLLHRRRFSIGVARVLHNYWDK